MADVSTGSPGSSSSQQMMDHELEAEGGFVKSASAREIERELHSGQGGSWPLPMAVSLLSPKEERCLYLQD